MWRLKRFGFLVFDIVMDSNEQVETLVASESISK